MAEGDASSAGINLGGNARLNKLEVHGDVIGRDKVIGDLQADADAAADRQQLLDLITRLQEQITALQEAPAGLRDDAGGELEKAHTAGQQDDKNRLLEKLETARGYLERIGEALPIGLQLASTLATIAQRANGLW